MEARKSYKQQNHEDPRLAFVRSPPLSVLLRSSNGCRRDYPAPTQPERLALKNSDYCEKVTVAWVISSSPKWNPSQLKRFKLFIRPNRARTKNLKIKKICVSMKIGSPWRLAVKHGPLGTAHSCQHRSLNQTIDHCWPPFNISVLCAFFLGGVNWCCWS